MKNNKNLFVSSILATVVLILSSCGSDVYDATLPSNARVKFIHTVADSAANLVDALVDGTKINFKVGIPDTLKYGAAYPSDSTYMPVVGGSHNIKVLPLGGSTGFGADVSFAAGSNYSIFAVDSLPAIGGLVVKDELPAPVQGKIAIRLVNLSANAPAYDLGVKGGVAINSAVAYKTASAFAQADIPVGNDTLKLEVRPAGGTTAVASFNIIKPISGRIFTILTKGYVGGRKASFRLSTSTLNNAR
jgi:hypothetical protein